MRIKKKRVHSSCWLTFDIDNTKSSWDQTDRNYVLGVDIYPTILGHSILHRIWGLLNGSWDFIWVRSVRNSPSTIYSIHHWSESPRCGDYTYKCQALKIQHKNWSEGSYNSTSLWWPIRPNLVAVCNFLLFSSFCWCLSVLFTNSYLFTPFCWWQASLYIFWAYNICLV